MSYMRGLHFARDSCTLSLSQDPHKHAAEAPAPPAMYRRRERRNTRHPPMRDSWDTGCL